MHAAVEAILNFKCIAEFLFPHEIAEAFERLRCASNQRPRRFRRGSGLALIGDAFADKVQDGATAGVRFVMEYICTPLGFFLYKSRQSGVRLLSIRTAFCDPINLKLPSERRHFQRGAATSVHRAVQGISARSAMARATCGWKARRSAWNTITRRKW